MTLTKFAQLSVLIAALTGTLPLLASCEPPLTQEQQQAKIYDVLHANAEIQKFLNTCETNGGIRELTASSISSRGTRKLNILCMNGVKAEVNQFK